LFRVNFLCFFRYFKNGCLLGYEIEVFNAIFGEFLERFSIKLKLKVGKILSCIHLVQFAEVFSPIDVFIVPNEFLQRSPLYFTCPLLYFSDNFQVSVCDKRIFYKLIEQFIDEFYHFRLVLVYLVLEPLLCLHLFILYLFDLFPAFLEGSEGVITGCIKLQDAFIGNFLIIDMFALVDGQTLLAKRQCALFWVRKVYS
jgi:hypothetical protein